MLKILQSGGVTTDTYLYLSLSSPEATKSVSLQKGVPAIIPISVGVDTNANSWGSCTLTITPTASSDKSIDKVSIGIYSDASCSTAITGDNVNISESNVITLTGITASETVYVKLLLDDNATLEEVNKTDGKLTCSFVKVA